MSYVFEYELCALLFLLAVDARFFGKRRFPSLQSSLFGAIIVFMTVNLAVDLASVYTISNALLLPAWINYAVNMACYSLQAVLPALLALYILALAGKYSHENWRLFALVMAPAALVVLLILLNPLTKLYFYVDPIRGYCHGPRFKNLFAETGIYFLAIFILLLVYHKNIKKEIRMTLMLLLLLCIVAVIVQFVYPRYLLSGAAIVFAITLMYFTIQSPEEMVDALTGAFERRAFLQLLRGRTEEDLYLIALDVDGMHHINETMGVNAGNEALAGIGSFLIETAAKGWAFRLSGDRFAIVAADRWSYDAALEAIRGRFLKPWDISGLKMTMGATGCAFLEHKKGETSEEILKLIETAIPEAKLHCRGRISMIGEETRQKAERRSRIESALRMALTGEGFSPWYQPIWSVQKRQFTAAEALLRLNDTKLGPVSPTEFIPIAEKNGMIASIDELVLNRLCHFVKEKLSEDRLGLESLEMNLSAANFLLDDLGERLLKVLKEARPQSDLINFEITESAVTAAPDRIADRIRAMNEQGVNVWLDDFGTGYANIARIARLPLYAVKIDRSLLISCEESPKCAVVFEDILRMCRRLGIRSVVEGIETQEQAEMAREREADYIQGYFYARPMPEEEFLAFLAEQNAAAKKKKENDGVLPFGPGAWK